MSTSAARQLQPDTYRVEWGYDGDAAKTMTMVTLAHTHREAYDNVKKKQDPNNERLGYVLSTQRVTNHGDVE
jgi:hypothetical protein